MTATNHPPPGAHDFDFLIGHWTVQHRRLKERLVGCTEWDTFAGHTELRTLMDGAVNVDDNLLELPAGPYRAVTLRSFDPATRQWAIWWLDGREPHQLGVPMIGGFSDGTGTFYAEETIAGQPVRVRFLWSDITASTCRWQQALSTDRGQSWEINWVMDFRRAA